MTAPQTGTATPEAAALANTFENEVNEFFGDVAPEPVPDTPSDGTTPAAADPNADTSSDAAKPADGDATPETPSEGTPPDAALAVEDDPFKDTEAASYMLGGKAIPVEDIRVFKEGGAVIRPESLPNILSKLARLDTVEPRERELRTQHDTLAKAVEWTTPEGKTLTGPEAAIELRIGNATLFAENTLMAGVIQADDLQPYLTTKTVMVDGQQKEVVIFKPEAISDLVRERDLQKRELTARTRDHFKAELSKVTTQAPAVDYAAVAPGTIQAVAKEAGLDASVLTQLDRELLTDLLEKHTVNGLASVPWQNKVKAMIQDRLSQKSSTAKIVDTTSKAVKEGQARMLAAARGVKKPVAPAVAPVKPPTPNAERAANQSDAWDLLESASARALRTSRA